MATIIPGARRGSFASALTQGLGGLVSGAMEAKQEQAQRMKFGQALRTVMPNLSQEQSESLLNLPAPILTQFLKGQQQAPANAAFASGLEQILGGGQQPQDPMAPQQMPQEGMPQQQQGQPGGLPSMQGLDRQGAYQLAQLAQQQQQAQEASQVKRSAAEERRRSNIFKENAPVLEKIEDRGTESRRLLNLSDDLLGILDSGEVVTGIGGKLLPDFLQTPKGQEFQSKLNELVLAKAESGKGVPSRVRLLLEQTSKPNIWQSPKTLKSLLDKIKNNPEVQKNIAMDAARSELEEKFGEDQPRNIKTLIQKRAHELTPKGNKEITLDMEAMPPAELYTGRTLTNAETGEQLISRNGQWVPLREEA